MTHEPPAPEQTIDEIIVRLQPRFPALPEATIRDAVRIRYLPFRYATGRTVTLENTNKLLGTMSDCNGMKTGYTNASGRCLISTAAHGGRAVILVQLGTKTTYIWNDGRALMDFGLRYAR